MDANFTADGGAYKFDVVCQQGSESLSPRSSLKVAWEEGAPHGAVYKDEERVRMAQVGVGSQHLADGAAVVTGIGPLKDAHIRMAMGESSQVVHLLTVAIDNEKIVHS